ncbi:MAG: spore coat associated protein CotJA [Butyricicoccus sp.]
MQNHLQTKESIPAGLLSLAMAFVPTQEFDTPYDPVLAFSRGTIFPALDKPFLGRQCRNDRQGQTARARAHVRFRAR